MGRLAIPDPSHSPTGDLPHSRMCYAISSALGSRDVSPWFADGSNYPGHTKYPESESAYLRKVSEKSIRHLKPGQRLLPRVTSPLRAPPSQHTNKADNPTSPDWGNGIFYWRRNPVPTSLCILSIPGHHYTGRKNIEQIVARGSSTRKLMGGVFNFNDRRYADDDLTPRFEIDPLPDFSESSTKSKCSSGKRRTTADIAYMVDQSHNLKGKIEAMIQTVCAAQGVLRKGSSRSTMTAFRSSSRYCSLIRRGGNLTRGILARTSGPLSGNGEKSRGLPEDPLQAFRSSGYLGAHHPRTQRKKSQHHG